MAAYRALTGSKAGLASYVQLAFYAVDVSEHPKLDNLIAVSREEGAPSPTYFLACGLLLKEPAPMTPFERHARCSSIFRNNKIVNHACVVTQCRVN